MSSFLQNICPYVSWRFSQAAFVTPSSIVSSLVKLTLKTYSEPKDKSLRKLYKSFCTSPAPMPIEMILTSASLSNPASLIAASSSCELPSVRRTITSLIDFRSPRFSSKIYEKGIRQHSDNL